MPPTNVEEEIEEGDNIEAQAENMLAMSAIRNQPLDLSAIDPKYASALQKAREQQRMDMQEKMIVNQMKQQHESAKMRADYDQHMVDALKNMTTAWEKQANESDAVAKKTEKLMEEIDGARIAREALERAAKEEIAAKQRHAVSQANIKKHKDALESLEKEQKDADEHAKNASETLEEAFEKFQKNSDKTGAAALAKDKDLTSQFASLMSSSGFTMPPGLPSLPGALSMQGVPSIPDMREVSSTNKPPFAKLVPPPQEISTGPTLRNVPGLVGAGLSDPQAVVSNAMQSVGLGQGNAANAISGLIPTK